MASGDLRGADGDDELAACSSGFEVSHGVGHLVEPVGLFDCQHQLAALDQSAELADRRTFNELLFQSYGGMSEDRLARLEFSRGARVAPAGLGADGPLVGAAAVGFRRVGVR